MSSHIPAIEVILQHEGTLTNFYVNDENDLGGPTCWGWSIYTIKNLGLKPRDLGINVDDWGDGTVVKNLTRAKAAELYKIHFWDKYGFAAIIDQTVATKCVDAQVNMGGNACKCAQKAVNLLIPGKLTVDGAWGPNTFGAINSLNPKLFIKAYSQTLLEYYQAIVVARPKNAKFLKTWTARSNWGM